MATIQEVLSKATPTQLRAGILRAKFSLFVQAMWSQIDPSPLQWGWHMEAICSCLQAVSEGRIRKLVMSVPPGASKSLLASVFWGAWEWTRDPSWALMTSSASLDLVRRDSQRWHDLILSPLYQELYGDCFKFCPDMDSLQYRKNDKGGERIGVSVGNGTGKRATAQIVDDPLTVDDARSEAKRHAAKVWFKETMGNRFRNQSEAIRIVISQRLHTEDISAVALEMGDWQHLFLPTEYDPANKCVIRDDKGVVVFEDPRKEPGELLVRYGFGPKENEEAKRELGDFGYASQQQQAPIPVGGGMLRREWLSARHSSFNTPGCEATPSKFERIAIVVDAAFRGGPKNDRVAMLVAGVLKARLYVLDMAWDQLDFVATVATLKKLATKWKATELAIEAKANGDAIISQLRSEIGYGLPLHEVEAKDSKEARVSAASPSIQGGCIVLPEAFQSTSRTVEDFLLECTTFPRAKYDDAVDALAHAVIQYCRADDFWAGVEADKSVWR